MQSGSQVDPWEVRNAFADYERKVRIRNYKVGCILAFVFMPAGASLDYFVYHKYLIPFLELRLICSALLAIVWTLLHFKPGRRFYRVLGLLVAFLPLLFITLMIYDTDGADSTYYAGLNLVMLGAATLLRWTLVDSIAVFVLCLMAYVAACVLHGPIAHPGIYFNNFYFLFVTGVFIITGGWFYNRIRFREFELRFELDRNRNILEETNRKLTELDQIKSRFFANISHELRTPLTLLMAPLETLIHGYGRAFDDETRGVLVTMHSNAMRLLKLINDLLDLVRLDSGVMQVKREPVEIGDFLRGLASASRQVARDRRIQLESVVAPDVGRVMVDRDKLEKIILNLQFNALKFTPAGGRVEVRGYKEGAELVLQVIDTGVGISESNLPFVFDRFWQADGSSRRKYQGVGIGLALVKELVDIQGGKVSVESKEGSGTTFTVRLPCVAPGSEDLQSAAAAPGTDAKVPGSEPARAMPDDGGTVGNEEWLMNLYRRAELFPAISSVPDGLVPMKPGLDCNGGLPKVLIADDEPDMLRFLTSQLSRRYQVFETVDGQQAIDRATEFLPDIILLDMMMPEKDGLQACREIREKASTQNIPIIILTARADEETKLAALSAGASDFLPKPFSTTELHVRVKNLVEAHEFQKKLARQNQVLESTIDQLKETELQLVQTEKIASLGRMSAGIIHEINNPLNFATTGLFALRNKSRCIPDDRQAEFAEILNDVEEGIKRVKIIVSELRSFSHPDTDLRDDVRVQEIVADALKFLSSEWRERIQIVRSIPEHQTIWGNKNRLVQVVLNLLQNSFDACQRKHFQEELPTVWIEGAMNQTKVTLTIRDNGDGIDPECMDKIFDPFFTTKDVGDGMGLGLSISYRIIQEHHGHVRVRSDRGKYSEFTLEFPVNRSN